MESVIEFPALDAERIEQCLHIAGDFPDIAYGAIAEHDKSPVGFITATMGSHTFSGLLVGIHDCWYVKPAYRGTHAAKKLAQGFEEWAFEHGAFRAILTIGTGLNIERMDKFIKLMGYRHMGGMYCKDGPTSSSSRGSIYCS